jgi:hypothetical protein
MSRLLEDSLLLAFFREGTCKEFYQELRNSGKEGTWQVFDQEMNFFRKVAGWV